jgi:hypothetical protein
MFTQTESLHASTWIHLRDCHGQSQMHVVSVLMLFKNHRRPRIYSGVWAIDKIGFSEEPSLYQRLEQRVIGAHSAIEEAGNNRDRIATSFFTSLANIGFSFGSSERLFLFPPLTSAEYVLRYLTIACSADGRQQPFCSIPMGMDAAITRSVTIVASQSHRYHQGAIPGLCTSTIITRSISSHRCTLVLVLLYSRTYFLTTIHVIVSAITPALLSTTVMPIIAPLPSSICLQQNITIAAPS